MKRLILVLALALPATLLLQSCAKQHAIVSVPPGPNSTLTKVAIYIGDIANTTSTLQTTIISLNQQKLLSDKNALLLANLCVKINAFESQASMITRGQLALTPAARGQLSNLINPLIVTFTADMDAGLLGISDPNTKNTISAALGLIQLTLTSIQSVIGAS